jgi:hypothetical protein
LPINFAQACPISPDEVAILDLEIEKDEVSGALRSAPFFFGDEIRRDERGHEEGEREDRNGKPGESFICQVRIYKVSPAETAGPGGNPKADIGSGGKSGGGDG